MKAICPTVHHERDCGYDDDLLGLVFRSFTCIYSVIDEQIRRQQQLYSRCIKISLLITTGLCFLPSCFPHLYYYITTGLTWKAAQDYCRSKYTDLATIHTEQEQTKLNQLLQSQLYVWIGLHADTDAWSWSLENQDYYGLGEAGFRMWAPFEPNDDGNYQVCVLMTTAGEWADGLCTWELPFICYSGKKGHTVAIWVCMWTMQSSELNANVSNLI